MQLAYDAPATTRLAAHTPFDALPNGELVDVLQRYAGRVDIHITLAHYILDDCSVCHDGPWGPNPAEAIVLHTPRASRIAYPEQVCAEHIARELDHYIDELGHDAIVLIPAEQF